MDTFNKTCPLFWCWSTANWPRRKQPFRKDITLTLWTFCWKQKTNVNVGNIFNDIFTCSLNVSYFICLWFWRCHLAMSQPAIITSQRHFFSKFTFSIVYRQDPNLFFTKQTEQTWNLKNGTVVRDLNQTGELPIPPDSIDSSVFLVPLMQSNEYEAIFL